MHRAKDFCATKATEVMDEEIERQRDYARCQQKFRQTGKSRARGGDTFAGQYAHLKWLRFLSNGAA